MVPADDGISGVHRRPQEPDLVEARVPFASDDQSLAVRVGGLSSVEEHRVDLVKPERHVGHSSDIQSYLTRKSKLLKRAEQA